MEKSGPLTGWMCSLARIFTLAVCCAAGAHAQSPSNTGTIEGVVTDPSGAAIPQATVNLHNKVTNFSQAAVTGNDGTFKLTNLPANTYHLDISAAGFSNYAQEVTVSNALPVQVKATLTVASATETVNVEAAAEALETDPSAHADVDRNQILKLPLTDPGAGLNRAIQYSTGAVSGDSNGQIHPSGDHAQITYDVDGQTISDQQSKVFSTSLPVSAIQSMEIVTGTPAAEFGDKSSLVAQITTRSGLGQNKLTGSAEAQYGSFGTSGGNFGLGWGTNTFGNFLGVEGERSGRFLDSPEFTPIHDIGNNTSLFDRIDFQPAPKDALHFNLFAARNWIQIPNDFDQLAQDQRQRVLTWSLAPGYQHTFNSAALLSVNPYVRKDEFSYYPSRNLFADQPATQAQQRQLLNWGVNADLTMTKGRHTLKLGVDAKQTRLLENFQFGITNPAFNSPCLNAAGDPVTNANLVNPAQCPAFGFSQNAGFAPSLLAFDLSRRGQLFSFHDAASINEGGVFVQDSISFGALVINPGFRVDHYAGLVSKSGPQPRLGIAYNIKKTGTVLRAAYARTFETPFNENLLLSSATGAGGLSQNAFGSNTVPIQPGFRNQFNGGLQQSLGKFLLLDADYFWKFTHNAYDFSTLLNSTITFPISWHNSKLDGVSGRLTTTNLKGFQAYWTFGHTRARFFPPEEGGLISQGATIGQSVFRIDHDQAFQSTVNLRYQHKKFEWIALTYRFDSGEVVSGVPDAGAALALTPNQQVTLGLACNGVFATLANPLATCLAAGGGMGLVTSKLITLPQGGYANFPSQENNDRNPDRVNARNIFNLAIGSDNLTHREGAVRLTASITIDNLTNRVALYNFLSTFSGTHFIEPRTIVARVGVVF